MIGQRLCDRYEILSELGRGGMGIVYHAWDQQLHRDVALKVMSGALQINELERLKREAQAVARLQHPNIVRLYDVELNNQVKPIWSWNTSRVSHSSRPSIKTS